MKSFVLHIGLGIGTRLVDGCEDGSGTLSRDTRRRQRRGEGAEGRKGRSWQRHWAANMMALVARLIDG